MMYSNNGLIDENLWKSDEWLTFYKDNPDLYELIKETFIKNTHFNVTPCLSTEFISNKLDKDPKLVHLAMAIWSRHFCTFYKNYGRIRYDTENNLWVYIKRQQ